MGKIMDKTERIKHIAEAFEIIAGANHYMVGFEGGATLEELEMAEQILIIKSNDRENKNAVVEFALDLIRTEMKGVKF